MKTKTRPIKFANFEIGGNGFAVIAGPCSVESQDQLLKSATAVKSAGAIMLRGGMFKLRTDPKSFQGLGRDAFEAVRFVKKETGLSFISEVTDPRQISDMHDIVDAFQVGSRNMHNYALLKELGHIQKPVLLKRGFSGLVKEWILAAEYITSKGNENIVLCERGIRTFETATRNTFDLNAIAYIKKNSHFPIIADPSHATGDCDLVIPMSLAAAASGADGIIVEVHPDPSQAKSDGFQALNFNQFDDLMERLRKILPALDRHLTEY